MYYQVVSFNYKVCSLEEREAIAFKDENEIKEFLNLLTDFDFIVEAFVVNTCNRVEIVSASKDNFATYHAILGLLSRVKRLNFHNLAKSAKRYEDQEAIEHIFSVVSSLDSMVVGEAQITGQVKDAFRLSYKNNTAGKELNNVISYAVKCAAEVRNSTQISSKPISIASVAVAKAEEELKSLSGMVGVVVGSGEMGKLAAKHLLRAGADVLLVSRTKEHAQELANVLGGENIKVGSYEKLGVYINKYRLLFSATSSKEPIITADMIESKNIDRLWFDMAIPRDIDNNIKDSSIKIFYIDDLKEISKNNHALRKEQALKASEIVKQYKDDFFKWLQALSVEPVIKQMRLDIDKIVKQEVSRVVKKGFISKEYQDNLEYMAKQLFDKYLHNPTKKMREISKESDGMQTIEAIKKVFNINTDSVDPKIYK